MCRLTPWIGQFLVLVENYVPHRYQPSHFACLEIPLSLYLVWSGESVVWSYKEAPWLWALSGWDREMGYVDG